MSCGTSVCRYPPHSLTVISPWSIPPPFSSSALPLGILFDDGHNALLGSDLITFNLHYAEISQETEFLVKKGRHGL